MKNRIAVICGAGTGFSASIARQLKQRGYQLALASRHPDRHRDVAISLDARAYACDVSDETSVADLFGAVDAELGAPGFVMFNPSARSKGPFAELDPADVRKSLMVTAFGGFLVAREAAQRMIEAGEGDILLTGASASVKGYAQSAPFAMGKFALRGMAQSMARELHPRGIHILHVVIDGAIYAEARKDWFDKPDAMLDPDAVATACLAAFDQPRNAWSWEIELRPWVETF